MWRKGVVPKFIRPDTGLSGKVGWCGVVLHAQVVAPRGLREARAGEVRGVTLGERWWSRMARK